MSNLSASSTDVMTSPSPASWRHRDVLRGALAASGTIGLTTVLFVIGWQLTTYDEQHAHIPGHWLYRTLVIAPGLVQLAYVIPIWRTAIRRRKPELARGVAVAAALALSMNLAVVALVAWLTAGLPD